MQGLECTLEDFHKNKCNLGEFCLEGSTKLGALYFYKYQQILKMKLKMLAQNLENACPDELHVVGAFPGCLAPPKKTTIINPLMLVKQDEA